MGARSKRLVATIAVVVLGLSACGGDDGDGDAPGIAAVEAYAEELGDEVAAATGELATWSQDPDRDPDLLVVLAEGIRDAEADDGDLPGDDDLAGETREVEGGTVGGARVLEHLGPARTESLAFADALDEAAGAGEVGAPVLASLNEASSSAVEATSALREALTGAGA